MLEAAGPKEGSWTAAARRRPEGEAVDEGSQRTRSTEEASGWRRNEVESAITGFGGLGFLGFVLCDGNGWNLKLRNNPGSGTLIVRLISVILFWCF